MSIKSPAMKVSKNFFVCKLAARNCHAKFGRDLPINLFTAAIYVNRVQECFTIFIMDLLSKKLVLNFMLSMKFLVPNRWKCYERSLVSHVCRKHKRMNDMTFKKGREVINEKKRSCSLFFSIIGVYFITLRIPILYLSSTRWTNR